MKQKFENFGLILSRDAQKKLVGGDDIPQDAFGEYTQCYSCTAGAKEWGFGCPSNLRSDCKCEKC